MLACRCLNVIIEVGEDDFQKVSPAEGEEPQDPFFQQEVQQVTKLININKCHSGLIQIRNVGSWVIHYCINCDVHTHAVHREKGASCILVNSSLLKTNQIESLKKSRDFSKVYKILVRTDEVDDEDRTSNSYLPADVENTIKGLKQVASDLLKSETIAVQERVKRYTEQQYNDLDELRERAFIEQQALSRIIINHTAQPASTNLAMSNQTAAIGMPSRLNEPLDAGSVTTGTSPARNSNNTKHTPKRQKSCPGHVNSYDAEALFDFDGIDDLATTEDEDVEESDVDEVNKEDDDDREDPRAPRAEAGMAKSLPMTIPAFMSQAKNHFNDDDADVIDIDNITDIAASMKAITKSLHGNTVFGELPRPRYSTHI